MKWSFGVQNLARRLLEIDYAIKMRDDVSTSPRSFSSVYKKYKNRMWLNVVCTHIDNDIRHHSSQNAPRESTTNFDLCDDEYRGR